MKPREKLLHVFELISDLRELTPNGKLGQLSVEDVDSSLSRQNLESTMQILADDHHVIKLHTIPDYENEFHYRYTINDNFDEVYDKFYAQSRFGINRLEPMSVLKIYDVALDIKEALSMTQERTVRIRRLPNPVRYQALFPADTIGLRDQYMEHRWNACKFLQEYGDVESFEDAGDGSHRWDGQIVVTVNRQKFDRDIQRLKAKYKAAFSKVDALPAARAEDAITTSAEPSDTNDLHYDDEHGKVTYKEAVVKLFDPTTIESFLLYRVCLADGARINASDIGVDFEAKMPEADRDITTKKLRNARKRINAKLNEKFALHEAVGYEREQFWLEGKYCSPKSDYKE